MRTIIKVTFIYSPKKDHIIKHNFKENNLTLYNIILKLSLNRIGIIFSYIYLHLISLNQYKMAIRATLYKNLLYIERFCYLKPVFLSYVFERVSSFEIQT